MERKERITAKWRDWAAILWLTRSLQQLRVCLVLYLYWVMVSFLKVKLFFVLRKAKSLLTIDIFSKLMGKL